MDFFSHGIWGYIIFHKRKKVLYAVLFALLPDIISWVPYFFYRIFLSSETFGKPDPSLIPEWTYILYNIGHSLLIPLFLILCIYIIKRRVPVYIYAWPISIAMDVLTHTREFLPTPFLWPVSDWTFPGIAWSSQWFMLLNLVSILIFLSFILWKRFKHSKV